MQTRNTYRDLVWIDLESPSDAEVRALMEEFAIDPVIAGELLLPSLKPRVEVGDGYLYLVLHFPALKHTHTHSPAQEIDFIVGKSFIITTRYDSIDPLHEFSKVFEVNSILDKSSIGDHAGYVFYYMLRELYESLEHEIETIEDLLIDVEEAIFEGREREMVERISLVARDLLRMRQTLHPHSDILHSLEENGNLTFGKSFSGHLRAVINEYYRIDHSIESKWEWLLELRRTNDSLVSTKQNDVTLALTIMAFFTFPVSMIASLFGMNVEHSPVVGHPFDFWIVLGIIGVTMLGLVAFFKYKKWL